MNIHECKNVQYVILEAKIIISTELIILLDQPGG